MAHERLDPGFDALIDVDAPVVEIGSGFTFTEGPIWHPIEHYLLFSDMPADKRRRWDSSGVHEISASTQMANGLTRDAQLNLIACEHASSSVVRIRDDGTRDVLATHFEGQELNSPNDLVVHSNGSIWFTDPDFGRRAFFGKERPVQLGFQGVYRIAPAQDASAEPTLLVDRYRFSQPNGLCFSPDESLLYINDTEQANIRVFDVVDGERLANGRLFATGIRSAHKPGVPDGMKCDSQGNVWVTAPGGVAVYSPEGRKLGTVLIPQLAANLAWGGERGKTLFVCATTSVYAIDTKVMPAAEPFRGSFATDGSRAAQGTPQLVDGMRIDPERCALLIQDMQNDVVMEGGAFADSGSPIHCREQNCIENIRRLAEFCRSRGIPVVHIWFLCEPDYKGVTLNAPLFEGLVDANALVRDTWGGAPVPGLEAQAGDIVVTKSRMSAWEGSQLETVLKAEGRDILIDTGAWTNMSIEHTARTGADKGYTMIVPEDACSSMNADWHNASIAYAMSNVAAVTRVDDVIRGLESAI